MYQLRPYRWYGDAKPSLLLGALHADLYKMEEEVELYNFAALTLWEEEANDWM